MLILFDQGTPVGIRQVLNQTHTVKTAYEQGWNTLLNGELLRVAEEAGFEILVTTDLGIAHQQNLGGRKIAIVVLSRNRWKLIQPMLRHITAAIDAAKPGTYTIVDVAPR